MRPFLSAGDFVVTRRTQNVGVGDVIVVNDARVGNIIKRILSVNEDEVVLEGDNPRLESSCCEYPHKRSTILGLVIFRFSLPFSQSH